MNMITPYPKSLHWLLVLLLSTIQLYSMSTKSTSTCISDDYIALKALYLSTDGDNWVDTTGWFDAADFAMYPSLPPTEDISLWHGITVDQSGCVTKLELYTNELDGTIPSALGDMLSLEVLDLGHNELNGNIPSEIGDLVNLEIMHLQSNQLDGDIPIELGDLVNLTLLNLQNNLLTGNIPADLGDLVNLHTLNLTGNQLTGNIPVDLGDLANLIILNLTDNQLTGPIPTQLSDLTNLKYLYLKYNQLTGPIPPQLGDLSQLIILSIHDNQLTGSIPEELGQLTNLQNLMLDDNRLSGEIPYSLGSLSSLIRLRLSGNYLTGTLPFSLAGLSNLTTLTFHDNDLSGCYFSQLVSLCSQITTGQNHQTSDGNNFCVDWEDFCANQNGLCGIVFDDPYCDCATSLHLNENPQPDYNNRAAYSINSDDIVDYEIWSSYKAGHHIDLDDGFEVKMGSTFEATIDDCTEGCQVSAPCAGTPCVEPDYELDSLGNKYVPNQLVIIRPDSVAASLGGGELNLYIDSLLFNQGFVEYPLNTTLAEFRAATSIQQCLCGSDIFLYEVDPPFQINEEDGGIAANTTETAGEEGLSFNLNHYVDASINPDEEPFPLSGTPTIPTTVYNADDTKPRIAFLDSGVNPEVLESGSILNFNVITNSVIYSDGCFPGIDMPTDSFGWNFVDDSPNIIDNRGHGTTVYLSYLDVLGKLNMSVSDQNTIIVKVLNECGIGTAYSTSCGMKYAAERGAAIINTSWGLYVNNYAIQNTIDEISQDGVIVSSSAGNSSKDLNTLEHFPSGYGYAYDKILDINDQTYGERSGIESVFEVSGLCRAVDNSMCLSPNEEIDLWVGANYRRTEHIFAEPSIELQVIVNEANQNLPDITCGIMGTSYAAPIFTAGLLKWYTDNPGQTISKDNVRTNSVSWTSDNGTFSSYLLENDQSCSGN